MSTQTVHVALYDEWADWEVGHAMARINAPTWQREPGRFRTVTVGRTRQPMRSIGGLTAIPDFTIDEVRPAESAMLILPGASSWDGGGNAEMARLAGDFLAAGVPVAAICGATFGLASAGLLDERAHTSSAAEYLAASGYGGAACYRNERAVTDGDLITAGATDGLEFALHILRRLDIFTSEALTAWYELFRTGDPAWYGRLSAA